MNEEFIYEEPEEYVNEKGDSRKLARRLIEAGKKKPDYPCAAHHIVAKKMLKASEAQKILDNYKIGINSPYNGIFLPTKKGVSNRAYHCSLHTHQYVEYVNNELSKAESKKDAYRILSEIAKLLMEGNLVWLDEEGPKKKR